MCLKGCRHANADHGWIDAISIGTQSLESVLESAIKELYLFEVICQILYRDGSGRDHNHQSSTFNLPIDIYKHGMKIQIIFQTSDLEILAVSD